MSTKNETIMSIKLIIKLIGASITMIALIFFIIVGCSKDDTPTEPDAFTEGHVWPAGDYPSLTAPSINNAPEIGEPILTLTSKHVGAFSPMLREIYGENWHGDITRVEGWECSDKKVDFNFGDTKYWSSAIPEKDFYFDYLFGSLCDDSRLDSYNLSWPSTELKRFILMQQGNWEVGDITAKSTYEPSGYTYEITRKFNQVASHPDLYMSMERDYLIGDDDQGSGEYKHTYISKVGVVDTQRSTIGETLELGAEATYDAISASVKQTFSSETTKEIVFSKESEEIKEHLYTIPLDEVWRFITLYGVERYFFSDKDGKEWSSPNLVVDELGIIEDKRRTFVMIVKYKNDSETPMSSEMIEIEK